MTSKPTAVVVWLPLREEQEDQFDAFYGLGGGLEMAVSRLGTPVAGGELPTEVFRIREHYKDNEIPWRYYKAPPSNQDASEYELEVERMLTHEQAQAVLAAAQAEIVRLTEENKRIERKLTPQFFCSEILEESCMDTREDLIEEAKSYDDDFHAFSVVEMKGYARVHKSYGFYDLQNKCHWFATEQEASDAAEALKGPAA